MIEVTDKSECCGCAACASACPVGCISMEVDGEGFAYPHADVSRCVRCGRCERVCPFSNVSGEAPVTKAYAVKSHDDELRSESSSGGVFTELCRPVIDGGGVVYGVAMNEGNRGCSFARAEDMDSVAPMRGSKYMQADSRGVHERVAADLAAGRRVLFSGTPCQANALSLYLGGKCDGLLLLDCICHGVPSPRLWAESVEDLEARKGTKVSSVSFRCKEVSWRRFGLRVEHGDAMFFQPLDESPYLRMFLRDVCLRESCYACEAKGTRMADITIADFWGVENVVPEMSDELGCSLVIVRTPAGLDALDGIGAAIERREVPYDDAVRGNPAVSKSAVRPRERGTFFADLDTVGYKGVARKYGTASVKERSKKAVKDVLTNAGLLGVAKRLRGVFP